MKQSHEEAVGQVFAFLVGGAIFVAALGGLLLMSQMVGRDTDSGDAAKQSLQASSLADILVGSPGIGWANPDSLLRLGLQASNGTGLNPAALEALRGAQYEANPNNQRVDYAEARASLGLQDDTDFHLRIYPIALESAYEVALSDTRVAYVGDWLSLPAQTVALSTPATMLGQHQAQLNLTIGPQAQQERAALTNLGLRFTNTVHVTASLPVSVALPLLPDPPLLTYLGLSFVAGDVYPDNKQYLDAALPARLANYDVLVIGSGIDQSTLTSSVTKDGIRDWVLAGGTLVVFGSNSQNFQWLQPLFSVGTANVNGGAFAPDIAHPLLHEPNELNWDAYDNHGLGWDIKSTGSGAHYNDFTHVVVEDGEDVLAVSNQGAFGAGRIFLTTYRGGEIAQQQGLAEAMGFVENILLYTEKEHLYLEYGPQIPDGQAVAATIRQSLLFDDELGVVAVRIELHVWGN